MKINTSLISGFAGAIALTVLHQVLKGKVSAAPRMEKLGRQALAKVLSFAGAEMPTDDTLQKATLVGDIAGNASYYSLVGIKPGYSMLAGTALGLTAGIGAVVLPDKLGLNKEYSNATTKTQVLTIGLYLVGGLVAGAVQSMLEKKRAPKGINGFTH